ncbi:hypothetical protein PPYR_03543 [Photinus pyralis]|uniref:Uncharacterized protein n=1 Tax=Photinus pyralis TaxID=7054 RepID=A0A5N4A340_PHOPY|nr:hypothetical protein PPYR_03543 [Photinus pyralis]
MAMLWGIKRYQPYLEDRHFTLKTNNLAPIWLNRVKDHCPERDNELPDFLSGNPTVDEIPGDALNIYRALEPITSANTAPHLTSAAIDISTLVERVKRNQQRLLT